MECRTLDLTIISAEGLKSIRKYDVYVVVHGTDGRELQITPVLRNTGSSDHLTWNFPMKFTIDEAEGIKDSLNLVIKIMAVNWLTRKTLGKVRVPIKDLMKDIKEEGKESQLVTYPAVNRKAEPGASLTFSYEFGKKFLHKVEVPYTKSDSKLEKSRSFMECRTLDLTIISAEGLKSISKYDVYVVVRGTGGRKLQITPVLGNAGSSDQLTWNFPTKFTIDEAEGLKDRLNIVIKIMAVNWLIRKTWGKFLKLL
ncbi:C2 calcium-dependent membrane targeting [Artemisia annua]|uniref:C2 calcium-dependent membrane targeting n=1 Tax=Artemisia annua TaxID=35608 RepID=A0A2U1P071_ARTAN|nr:C2 calcium-dependent membrane targeting [Artemisia annua]